ncbi:Bcr/CflA family multidrug efflux MFS transporter [Ferrimonas lipolytica]|uniref:Bcr/CflA family efflux transporter n=1 Tax=Ferrimonas lipolytica TaxID=2724191 RepID=A0A6H1UEH4_9GAMM|nr:Bcr/CflA family multidrug efflux MFS transporter [Ferrimonas lipolytica]QIZ77507.1 Bcr/CflA family multidrug efflux MFS transporter [Ferrimonas lipolytica]
MARAPYPIVITILGIVAGLTPLAIDMYLPAIPALGLHFSEPVERVQLSVSVYLLFFGFGQLLFGPLTDAIGRLKVMNGGLMLFGFASLGCIFSHNLEQLLMWRALQAVAGAATSVVTMGMIRDRFKRDEFARAVSFVMLVMQLAPLLAPILGGYLLVFAGWESLFVLLAIVAMVMLLAVSLGLGETLPPERRHSLSFRSAIKTYLTILRHRPCLGLLLVGIMTAGSLFSFIAAAPFVYIEHFGVAPENFGYIFGLNVVLMMICTSFNARYVAKLGARRMLSIGLTIAAFGAVLMLLCQLIAPDWMWGMTIPGVFILGPIGMIAANSTSLALEYFDNAAGSVAALGGFMRFTWGAASSGLISWLHNDTTSPLAFMMISCTSAAVLIFWLQSRATLSRD